MNMLLAFAPFIVFALFDRLLGVVPALSAAALVSALFLVRDWLAPGRTVKVLEIGTLLLFGGLALYAVATHTTWSLLGDNVITAAWAAAFALMVLADVAMIYMPALPLWVGIAVTVAAIAGAIRFTQWYPAHMRARFQAAG